jgi:hypothetical protein
MARLNINIGTADKGDGDPIRTAFAKVNNNFQELYDTIEELQTSRTTEINLDAGGATTIYDTLGLNIDGGLASTIFSASELSINGGGAQ